MINTKTKTLSQFFDEQRPPYAILSHTWGTDEVALQDLNVVHENSLAQSSSTSQILLGTGWRKIEASCDQAARDGFEWIWVDTCCIDKTSSAELSEAINSMYAWYRDSQVCYAFLSDVDEAAEDISTPDSAFRTSRWFTRGWTLQELLAPRKLVFFTSGWQAIGQLTRDSKLSEVASEITSIPCGFLGGLDLRKANVAMKMSWASKRVTTRKEDTAYCLLGIFDVNMPLLYGEGMKAFGRLQEEIIRRRQDHSLLAWGLFPWNLDQSLSDTSPYGALATSVADFAEGGTLGLCPRFLNHKSINTFKMTYEGLHIQTAMRRLGPDQYAAVLDCYCRQNPSKRIAIPVRKARNRIRIGSLVDNANIIENGDTFVRTGRGLMLSDISPNGPLKGPKHFFKTIILSVEKDVEIDSSRLPGILSDVIEIPRHYRYELKYVDPRFKVEKDPYAVESQSLQIQRQQEETIDIGTNHPDSYDFVKVWTCRWSLLRDMLANIIKGKHVFAQLRPRLDSTIICLELIKGNCPTEPACIIALIAYMPMRIWEYGGRSKSLWCGLSPMPEQSLNLQFSQLESVQLPRSQDLVGHRSLQIDNETLKVREFMIPDRSVSLQESRLFRIDVEETNTRPRVNVTLRQIPIKAIVAVIWFYQRGRYVLWAVLPYGIAVVVLAFRDQSGTELYLTIWTLLFMPLLFEIREQGDGWPVFGLDERHIVRYIVFSFGILVSIYTIVLSPVQEYSSVQE